MKPAAAPLISVIVPVYNAEDCLERCVHSITRQTYGNLEILLIDDGSPDRSGALCDALAVEDPRIRVIHQENAGSSAARNRGIEAAQGEYLGFVDCDDELLPEMYMRLMEAARAAGPGITAAAEAEPAPAIFGTAGAAEAEPAPAISGAAGAAEAEPAPAVSGPAAAAAGSSEAGMRKAVSAANVASVPAPRLVFQIGRREIAASGERLPDICIPPEQAEVIPSKVFFRELLMHRGDCSFCTKLIARDLIGKNRFPEGELNEDFRLFLDLLSDMDGIYALPDYGYLVHYKEESNSRTKDPEAFPRVFTDIVNNADYAEALAAGYYPELKKEALRFGAYQRLDYLLHIPISKMTEDNRFYLEVVRWVRSHMGAILASPHLTAKNKAYLLLLGTAPKFVRSTHKRLRGL